MMAACPPATMQFLGPADARPTLVDTSPAPSGGTGAPEPLVEASSDQQVAPGTRMVPQAQAEAAQASMSAHSEASQTPPAATPRRFDWSRYAHHATAIYFLGVLAFLARFVMAFHGGTRLRRRSRPVEDQAVLSALAVQAKRLGLAFTPAVAYCARVVCPTVVGVVRPTILLPPALLAGVSPEQLEALLAHELAHIRRYDNLINVLQRLIEAFLFFHPGVWCVSRRVRIEREHCCDDRVVAAGARPIDYAASLVRLAELARSSANARGHIAATAALGSGDRPSQLHLRVLRLLEGPTHPQVRLGRAWGVGFVFLTALTMGIALHHRTQAAPDSRASVDLSDANAVWAKVLEVNRDWLCPHPENLSYVLNMANPAPGSQDHVVNRVWLRGADHARWEISGQTAHGDKIMPVDAWRVFSGDWTAGSSDKVARRIHADTRRFRHYRQGLEWYTGIHVLADFGLPENARIVGMSGREQDGILILQTEVPNRRGAVGLGLGQVFFGQIQYPLDRLRLHIRLPEFVPILEEDFAPWDSGGSQIDFGPEFVPLDKGLAPKTIRYRSEVEPGWEWALEARFQIVGDVWLLKEALNLRNGTALRKIYTAEISTQPVDPEVFRLAARGQAELPLSQPSATQDQPVSIVVEVTQAENGKAIADAKVVPEGPGTRWNVTTRTDARGLARLEMPRDELRYYSIKVMSDGYVPQYTGFSNAQGPPTKLLCFKLNKAVEYGGFVRDEQGKGIQDVLVYLIYSGRPTKEGPVSRVHNYRARTDANGRWTSHILPAVASGLQIYVTHPDYVGVRYDELNKPLVNRMNREANCGGLVTDSLGRPVADARVALHCSATRNRTLLDRIGLNWTAAMTDAHGRWTTDLRRSDVDVLEAHVWQSDYARGRSPTFLQQLRAGAAVMVLEPKPTPSPGNRRTSGRRDGGDVRRSVSPAGPATALPTTSTADPGSTRGDSAGQSRPTTSPPPEDSRTPEDRDALGGVVRSPDGKPVKAVDVALCTKERGPMIRSGFRRSVPPVPYDVTDSAGQFSLRRPEGAFALAAIHDSGYREITGEEFAKTGRILLQPWGRVEGVLKIGAKPAAGETVTLMYETTLPDGHNGVRLHHDCQAKTDASGHFVLEKLPPGEHRVARSILEATFPDGGGRYGFAQMVPVTIEPGKTVKVELGGRGRAVVGRLRRPHGYKGKIDWRSARQSLSPIRPDPKIPGLSDFRANTPQANALREAWYKTDAGKAYSRAHKWYAFVIGRDGRFRIDDIPAGRYELGVAVLEPPKRDHRGPEKEIGGVHHIVEVPEMAGGRSDEALDIGTLTLETRDETRPARGDVSKTEVGSEGAPTNKPQHPSRQDPPAPSRSAKGRSPSSASATPTQPPKLGTSRVTGVVVDSDGRGVGGAEVVTYDYGRGIAVKTRAAADGTFALEVQRPNLDYTRVIATADGGRRKGLYDFGSAPTSSAPSPIRITLKPSHAVAIRVVDGSGKPVPGASIEALHVPAIETRTSPAGSATLYLPKDAKIRGIVALKSGVGFDYFAREERSHSIGEEPLPSEMKFVLDGVDPVRVRATDSAGRPIAGTSITPFRIKKPGKDRGVDVAGSVTSRSRTDARGVATFDWFPANIADLAPFTHWDRRYHLPKSIAIRPSATDRELEVVLLGKTSISGRVLQPDGKPAPGILLRLEGRGGSDIYIARDTRTASDGSFALDVDPEQSYIVAVIDDNWTAVSKTGVLVKEGKPVVDLELRLIKGTRIHGQVTTEPNDKPGDEKTIALIQEGAVLPEPLRGESIYLKEQLIRTTKTDSQGRYSFRVGPGEYELTGPERREGEKLSVTTQEEIRRDFRGVPEAPGGRSDEALDVGT
ncbi:MAG: M48 family metalloprotease [Phycisphaerae bacterium]|nr:M48 family metalloprotease [Phycisphaerae bacterium]